jgi:hypothetical protein
MEEMIFKLKDQQYFSKIDLQEGFFQIPLAEEDKHKTAFRVKNRLYEWNRMPMGFKNSSAVFQRYMDTILGAEIGKSCFVYVDDILIFGKDEKEHDEAFKRVVKILIENNIVGNKDKIEYKKTSVIFLGHRLRKNQIEACIDLKQPIEEYPRPHDLESVRKFHGLINYYRKYIPGLSTLIEPILNLTRKNVKFVWTTECEEAFNKLKSILMSNLILRQPDHKKRFYLESDASNVGLGAVLSQMHNNELYPIAYASRKLNQAERNYGITEKEMLAAIWAMEHFQYYLKGIEFELTTDHKALEALNPKGDLKSARIHRWIDRIQNFNFTVKYRKGTENNHVDALSRSFEPQLDCNTVESVEETSDPRILELHEKLVHRGAKAVYNWAKDNNWENITYKKCQETISKCPTCKFYNPIRIKGMRHIQAHDVGELFAFDIVGPYEKKYILPGIDYFYRTAFAEIIPDRSAGRILKFLKQVQNVIRIKKLISDGARENKSNIIKNWCIEQNIEHHFTTPYHHQSNGRIERLNRTIQEGLNKLDHKTSLKKRLKQVLGAYNTIRHEAIKMSPSEALKPERREEVKKNQFEYIIKTHKALITPGRKTYQIGDTVLLKNENPELKKREKFNEIGTITNILPNDVYHIKTYSSDLVITRHADQLRILEPVGALVERGDVVRT